MRTFLILLMVLIASGDDVMTINGFVEDSVLLPCTCLNRNLDKDFRWQMEGPRGTPVFKYMGEACEKYEGRVKHFLDENITNCSILLINITNDDQGRYRCSFYMGERYTRSFVNLTVSGKPHQQQSKQTSNSPTGSVGSMGHLKTFPLAVLGFSLMSKIFI